MRALYEWADFIILPTHHEGFPRVLIEGALCGCGLICTAVGGIPYALDQHSFAKLEPNDSSSISKTIIKLQQDSRTILQLKKSAYKTARALMEDTTRHDILVNNQIGTIRKN